MLKKDLKPGNVGNVGMAVFEYQNVNVMNGADTLSSKGIFKSDCPEPLTGITSCCPGLML